LLSHGHRLTCRPCGSSVQSSPSPMILSTIAHTSTITSQTTRNRNVLYSTASTLLASGQSSGAQREHAVPEPGYRHCTWPVLAARHEHGAGDCDRAQLRRAGQGRRVPVCRRRLRVALSVESRACVGTPSVPPCSRIPGQRNRRRGLFAKAGRHALGR
jgi:hypothetical protein